MTTNIDKQKMDYIEGFVKSSGHKIIVNPYIFGLVKSKCGNAWAEKYLTPDVGVTRGQVADPSKCCGKCCGGCIK